jgi:hypothetical protein
LHTIFVLQKTSIRKDFCHTQKRAGNLALLTPTPSELARHGRAGEPDARTATTRSKSLGKPVHGADSSRVFWLIFYSPNLQGIDQAT